MTSFSSSRSLLNFPRQREKRQRRGGGCWGERKGPEVCLGGRWLSVAVNRQLFDAIVLAQACLSHSVTAIKDSLTAKTGACVSQANPHILSFTPGIINFVKSGSVNYEGARSLSPEEEKKTKTKLLKWYGSPVSALHMIIGKCLEKDIAFVSFYSLYSVLTWCHMLTVLHVAKS